MAEDDSSQEKTEEPTSKRLDQAREEGQIPRSRELTTTLVLLVATCGLMLSSPLLYQYFTSIASHNFGFERRAAYDVAMLFEHLRAAVWESALALLPLMTALLLIAVIAPPLLGGWLFSAKAISPKFSRLNPLSGLKRLFSMNALVELGKALAKFFLIAGIAVWVVIGQEAAIFSLALSTPLKAVFDGLGLVGWVLFWLSLATLVIAVVDVPYQMWSHTKKLRMTKQQIKDEMKEIEGKPEVKQRIRQLQFEISQRRMMGAVPEADVVITNPEHFSIALKYDLQGGGAPMVVAKGVDHMAMKIREVANAHGVELFAAPTLARAIYFSTDIDEEIPQQLYLAVAQVLAYVYQLRDYRNRRTRRPQPPRNFDIPDDLRYDSDGKPASKA